MQYDCGFTREQNWFRYRAAAIIIENGCILYAGNDRDDYFYSVGGGVHMGETAEDAVRREVLEETGISYEIDQLAFIHENFFSGENEKGESKGMKCHEISFYFVMKPRGTQELNSNSYTQGIKEHMHWIPIDELEQHRAYPLFLKDRITKFGTGVEHIVTHE